MTTLHQKNSKLFAAAAKSLQSCPTLCDPIDGSPPGSPSLGFSRQEHWSGLPFPSPMVKVKSESEVAQSCPTLSNPMDCSHQTPPSMGFSRQEYWSGVPLPSPLKSVAPSNINFLLREDIFSSRRQKNIGSDGTPLQYSCPENPMDGGAWLAAVHGVAKCQT